MKKYQLIILLAFIFIINMKLYSQDSLFPKNHFALQYQVEDLLKISDFNKGIFSAKYIFENMDQLRFGVSFNIGNGERNQTLLNKILEENTYGTKLNIQYLFGISSFYDVLFFSGCGPYINYYHSKFITKYADNNSVSTKNVFNFGLNFIVGVEWFIRKNISISLESGFNIYYRESSQYNVNDFDDNYFNLIESGTKLGLAIYF